MRCAPYLSTPRSYIYHLSSRMTDHVALASNDLPPSRGYLQSPLPNSAQMQ